MICREHTSSQYSKLKPRAVPLCSLPCDYNIDCLVSDAARATSAAPTFFPSKCINDRLLVDGGLGHNNPSFDIFYHYHRLRTKNMIDERNKVPRICDKIKTAPMFSTHGDLDCSRLRFTNIGTGVKIDEDEPDKHGRLARLVPGAIKNVIFLVQTLKDTAVSSESTADIMRILSYVDDGLEYERFDATYGVSKIKLDDHNALDDIRAKTKTYLGQQDTKEHLDKVAFSIATDYVNTLAPATCGPLVEIQPTVSNSTAPIQVTQEPISRLILSTESSGSSTAVKGHPHRGLHVQFTSGDNPRGSRPASSVETHVPDSSAQSTVSQDEHGVSGLGLETH